MHRYNFIAIEGCIGAGKTSLASKWAHDLGAKLVLEEFADNPFLPKFYENPERYAFPLELSFLSERFSQLKKEIIVGDLFRPTVVSDYIISKCQVFARNNLSKDEYDLFLRMFDIVQTAIPEPDLLIYLYRDTASLLKNIAKRGREYEQKIEAAYLDSIQQNYMEFIRQHPRLRAVIVDCGDLDFLENQNAYSRLSEILHTDFPTGISRFSLQSGELG